MIKTSRLKSLELENFKSIKNRTRIDFAPITLFFGPNSAGKSSIADALNIIRLFCTFDSQMTNSEVSSELKSKLLRWTRKGQTGCSFCIEISVPITEYPFNSDIEKLCSVIKEIDINVHDKLIKKIETDSDVTYKLDVNLKSDENRTSLRLFNPKISHVKLEIIDICSVIDYKLEQGKIETPSTNAWDMSYDMLKKNKAQPPILLGELLNSLSNLGQGFQNLDSGTNAHLRELQDILRSEVLSTLLPFEEKVHGNRHGYTEFNTPKKVNIDPFDNFKYSSIKPAELLYEDFASKNAKELMTKLYINKYGPKPISEDHEAIFHCYERSMIFELVNTILNDELFLDSHYQIDGHCDFLINKELFFDIIDEPTLIADNIGLTAMVNLKLHAVIAGSLIQLNFEDVGDGISFMLPVIIACALSKFQNTLIEQPELHLHPSLQQALADVIVKHGKNSSTTMIVETHSEHLILRMLRRIKESKILKSVHRFKKEDISVYYFDPTISDGTYVSRQYVTDDGDFEIDWPRGFFTERDVDLTDLPHPF